MCMSVVVTSKPDPKAEGWAWKVFTTINEGVLYWEWRKHAGRKEVPQGKWLHRRHPRWNPNPQYPLGFHLYMEKPEKVHFTGVVRLVEWRGLLAVGYQDGGQSYAYRPVIVASSIRVPNPE